MKNPEKKVGPPMRMPVTMADLLSQIEMQTEAWQVRYEWAWDKGEPELFRQVQVSTEEERDELKKSLRRLRRLLSQLGEDATNLGERVGKIRVGLKRPEEATTTESAQGKATGNSKK
jgi:hypothetical protein